MPADQAQQYDVIGNKGIIGFYFQALEQYAGMWTDAIANTFSSNQDTETYGGIGTVPQLREWLGGKQAKSFTEQSLRITNKDWESTIRIKNKDRRRDKTGQIQAKMAELAERTVIHDASLLSTLIQNGTGTTYAACYDGLALFSDTHSVGSSGTTDNSTTIDISALPLGDTTGAHGSTTAPSVGEAAYTIMTAIQTLYGFKDDRGEPINEFARSFQVQVPVSLSAAFQSARTIPNLVQGFNNPLLQQQAPAGGGIAIDVVVNPRLTFTDSVAVFRTDAPYKPFIIQREIAPMMKLLAEGSDHEFMNNEILVSIEKSGNVGLGRFDQAVLIQMV